MNTQQEAIFQKAMLSRNPPAVLNVAWALSDLGETEPALALLDRVSNELFHGIMVRQPLLNVTHIGMMYGFGTDYAAVQTKLNALGASPTLATDGQWGPKSKAALIAYQKSKGLSADGIPGPITLGALGISDTVLTTATPATELPPTSTPMDAKSMADALAGGYKLITGKAPTKDVLGLMLGQVALETGNFGHGVHQFNFGNKKYSGGDPHWQYFRCSEIVNGKEVFYDPPHPACKFAAYDNPAQAGAAYVHTLKSRQHWWDGLQTGTAQGFITGLTIAPKYFTANPSLYLKGVQDRMMNYESLAEEFAKKYATPIAVASGGGLLLLGLTALGIFLFRRPLGLVH